MTKREKMIVRMAMNYMVANLDDVNTSFADFKDPKDEAGNVRVDGKVMPSVSELEIHKILKASNK